MRSTAAIAAIATLALAACDSPPMDNAPPEENLVNATATDQAFPSTADGNQIITGEGEGVPTGAEASDASAGSNGASASQGAEQPANQ